MEVIISETHRQHIHPHATASFPPFMEWEFIHPSPHFTIAPPN